MAKKESYNLSESVIKDIIDPIFTKGLKNRDAIKSMIVNVFNSGDMEVLINIIFQKTKYKELTRDCYVKVIPKIYWAGEMYEKDRLQDMGLLCKNGRIYGKVISNDSWNNEEFNPFYHKFRVKLFLHNDQYELEMKEETISGSDLELLDDQEIIKHLKVSKNG